MTSEDALKIAAVLLRAALETPAGKELVATLEQAVIDNAPGAAGAFVRALAAIAPHDVESIGFKKDGPG